ncbi:MAG: long-chain acyl-CoA synthetase [Actinomycetota bacterium]|nr:long-chain acyl-CoA synthetase [Actinomycetota bacterium]
MAWCKQNLAGYEHPRVVEFPMTSTGKVLKRELR